jgi:hypothetical protein
VKASPATVLKWLIAAEDHPDQSSPRAGQPLIDAALADELIAGGEEDQFALTILALYHRGLIELDYPLLEADQGDQIFRGQPSYHLAQIKNLETTPQGRRQFASTAAVPQIAIGDLTIQQLALGDIQNNITLSVLIDVIEQAVQDIEAPAQAKADAAGWLKQFRASARAGGELAQATGAEVLAKVIAKALGIPPG